MYLLEHLHVQKVFSIRVHFFGTQQVFSIRVHLFDTLHLCRYYKRLLLQHFIKGYGIYINPDNFTFKVDNCNL